MADDELKKLKRPELLDMLAETTRENERLKAELSELRAQLANRQLDVLEAGSIAEASMKLNNVFEAAQAAADQYLDNIERLYRGRGELVREAQSKAQALVAQAKLDAQDQFAQVRIDADTEAEQIRSAARVAADEARQQARLAREEADEARRAALRAKDEASSIIQQAKDEALALIEKAQADAAAEAERIESEAQGKADTLLAEARLQAQLRMDEAERVSRNFEMATKVKCDNTMRRAMDEAHTYGSTMRMAMRALGITPEMAPALEEPEPEDEEAVQAHEEAVSDLDEAVKSARAAVAAALSNAKTAPGTLDDESVAAMYPASAEQL
jgi:regulator of replication initiation timing